METAKNVFIVFLLAAFLILFVKSTTHPPTTDNKQLEHTMDNTERAVTVAEKAVELGNYWKDRAEKCEQSKGKK